VEAIKLGADNYLAKPADTEEILTALLGSSELGELSKANVSRMEPMSIRRLEWEHIQKVLKENNGNISATARQLKMHRRTLQRKLQKKPVAR
jgi:two-component system response regulator RegA